MQAVNSWWYRQNLKKRCKAGSPNALRARSAEKERHEVKAEKRKAARALAEPPPSPAAAAAPAPAPQRKRKYEPVQSVDELPIEGQCQGITKEGKRCCVHRLSTSGRAPGR